MTQPKEAPAVMPGLFSSHYSACQSETLSVSILASIQFSSQHSRSVIQSQRVQKPVSIQEPIPRPEHGNVMLSLNEPLAAMT